MLLTQLKDITAFFFDVDGVLTDGSVFVTDDGLQMRKFDIKDGYALQLAVKRGYHVCAISGANTEAIRHRLNRLGIKDVFLGCSNKSEVFQNYISEKNIKAENTLFMGDDIPDLQVMKLVGLPVCPADAVEEIKAISAYISPARGGKGCVRDVIEKAMKLQGKWIVESEVRSI